MIIENKATGQRFEIADGALYPKAVYREVKPEKEEPKVDPEPFIETPIEPESQRPEEPVEEPKKPAKKKKTTKSKKTKKTSK